MTALNSRLQLALISRKKKQNILQQGFTLVELMVVIVIVGILSAIALPNFLSQTNKAKATECTTKGGSIMSQVGAEGLNNPTDAKTILDDLVLEETGATGAITEGNSELCNFTAGAAPAVPPAAQIFTLTVVGKTGSPIDGEYFGAFCVNSDTGKKDTSISTTTAQTAANVDCT